eukprot:15334145-Ditylum_brightwellii.AAC.1
MFTDEREIWYKLGKVEQNKLTPSGTLLIYVPVWKGPTDDIVHIFVRIVPEKYQCLFQLYFERTSSTLYFVSKWDQLQFPSFS